MLHIVMDGAGDMPPDWAKLYDIQVIPINIQFGNRTFLQGVELSNEDFYRIVDERGVIPQTSQPSPQQFVSFYERIAQVGDTILSLHVTSRLSGTFASAQMAAMQLRDRIQVIPFDTASGSAAQGFMCREARLLERAGRPVEAILERLEFIRRNVNIVLTLANLEYARKSGRVKALQAAIASLLDVKPIIILKDGALDMAERVRTRRKAIDRVIQIIHQRVGERLVNVAAVHARDPEAGESLLNQVRGALNCNHLILTDLSISVAANLGPGTVGLAVYPELEG